MGIIVQKYGGSSLSDISKLENVANQIVHSKDEGLNVVVIVSAMGDSTDRLVQLAK